MNESYQQPRRILVEKIQHALLDGLLAGCIRCLCRVLLH